MILSGNNYRLLIRCWVLFHVSYISKCGLISQKRKLNAEEGAVICRLVSAGAGSQTQVVQPEALTNTF